MLDTILDFFSLGAMSCVASSLDGSTLSSISLEGLPLLGTILPFRFGRSKARPSGSPGMSRGGPPPPEEQNLERVRADVRDHGWHVVLVQGEGRRGFAFTVGLWETYRHPEIIVFAAGENPQEFAEAMHKVARRVTRGRCFPDGELVEGAFGRRPGQLRRVRPRWLPEYLGTAAGFYGSFDFPVLQLFWPDEIGRFPWMSQFNRRYFGLQPALFQENVILTGVGYEEMLSFYYGDAGSEDRAAALVAAEADLFVSVAAEEDPLEAWRWRLGTEAEALRITLFGDVFVGTPEDGNVYWLDTGANELVLLAEGGEDWRRAAYDNPATLFRASTLLQLRDLGLSLEEGSVYGWIVEPMAGGSESFDNHQRFSLHVHLDATGELAEGLTADLQASPAQGADDTIYTVVVNPEEQYSLWPAGEEIPDGWKSVGKSGTKDVCLGIIEELWIDLRPKSQR